MRKHPILIGCGLFTLIFAAFVILLVAFGSRGTGGGFAYGGGRIAVVPIEGIIVDSRDIVEQLDDFRRNDNIDAVVIRIDSPGGAVGPSQEIYQAVRRLKKEKPVVASFGSVAASGGYYIAVGAEKIVSNPGAITGSIGVIIEFLNVEGILKWAKIRNEIIKSGEFKDIGSSTRQLSKKEKELLQVLIDDVHDQFVQAVAEGREMDTEIVAELANGMIYSGRQALNIGLVDELGDLNRAVEIAAELAEISGEPRLVYPPKPPVRLRDLFGKAENLFERLSGFTNIRILYLWRI